MKKLTIIVGAGASCEFNLPTGAELKGDITRLVDLRYDFRLESGDHQIDAALRLESQTNNVSMQDLVYAAWRIRDALPQAISIDNFIDSQRDRKIEFVGKLAIVRAILQAERKSTLYVDPRGDHPFVKFSATSNSWLNALFQLITQNCIKDELAERLRSISFIIFNYDRCIEHYLHHAVRNYYNISEQEVAEILSEASFYHPYGTVGSLPWQRLPSPVSFGNELHPQELRNHASQIRTFTEGTDPSDSQIAAIRDHIRSSERLLFLGFAYHQLNMELINPGAPAGDGRVRSSYGTSWAMSDFDSEAIATEIATLQGSERRNVHIRKDLKCGDIFREFSRGISIS